MVSVTIVRMSAIKSVIGFNINSLQAAYSTFMPDTVALKLSECKPMDVPDAN